MATTWRNKKNYPLGVGTLNTAIDDNDLSIVLDAGQGASFPSATFTISIDEEIILIDSRSTDTLTVNASGRGYDSSTASAHAAGVAIANNQIVKDFTDLETAVNGIENGTTALLKVIVSGTVTSSITVDDATNSGVTSGLEIYHTTSGSPAAGIGTKIVLGAEDSAGNSQTATEMHGYLSTVTNAAEVGGWLLRIVNAGSLIDVLTAVPASLTLAAVSNACKIFAGAAVMKQTSASQAQFGYEGSSASYSVLLVNNSTGAGNPSIGFDFFGAAPTTQNVNLFRSSTAISGDSFFTAYVPGSATVSFQVNAKQGTTATRQGAAADLVLCGGVAYVNTTAVGNVGAGEDDLMSYSVPASTLGTNNNSIYFEMHFTTAANANNKTIKVKYGATTIWDSTAVAANNQRVIVRGRIYRTGAATQIAVASVVASGTFTNTCVTASPAETLSGAVTLKATGEATSDNDVQQLAMFVGWDAANT